ncbi:MAG: zinc-dependent alcohol dehydrogenase [Acetivibrionales bacterium]
MKALVKCSDGPEEIKYKEVPKPELECEKVLVKVKSAAICHTDVMIINNEYKGRKPVPIPLILGHEGAGIVEETYSKNSIFKAGDRVAFEPLSGCRKCNNCKNGYTNMCTDWDHIGITCDGVFAEYVTIPERTIHKLPDEINFSDAALLEPTGLTARSIENVKPVLGDIAAVIGPGPIGLLHVQALKASGCKVIVIGLEQDKYRLKVAEELGADLVINGSKVDPCESVNEYTNCQGVDIVIETASSPKALNTAFEIAGAKARVSAFGLYPEATVKFLNILRKGLTIYGDVGMLPRHFEKGIKWMKNGDILAKPLITHRYKLEEGVEAFRNLKNGNVIKAIFEM